MATLMAIVAAQLLRVSRQILEVLADCGAGADELVGVHAELYQQNGAGSSLPSPQKGWTASKTSGA